MSEVASVTKAPETAAHELTLELVKALGTQLSTTLNAEGGKKLAGFLTAFHAEVADHYRTRGQAARSEQ